jgi:hypothetical protein
MLSAAGRSKPSSERAIDELPCRASLSIHSELSAANRVRTLWVIALLILLAMSFLRRLYGGPAVTEQKPTIRCHGTPSAEKVPGVPWSLHAARRGRSPWRCEACSMGKMYFLSGFMCSNRAGERCTRSSSGSGVTTGGKGAAGFFCDTEEARDVMLAKTPI